ncbi:hypothetical protein PF010_g8008 [Phytophthora fragariae]|uniref:Uncharacterized protein n=2 Tax=Phytophthora TaxID=4783 RepID=A0A6A3WB39_9STRA|nr:hypothetical protein PF009_g6612 [Phytophthora fragariae]KAE8973085.1 hypothetical protein PR001_g26416 [Phytophthora rubi]KAE9071999.1 hypothetical protein PF007_g26337 [Phytophthora fragariae]KAE9119010.1 hypothetical protein PF010_g8008 [Phytophthora fragariae]KAE9182192.1 hypothetical protein PF002_g27055 [Phytophthora fragariae]
MDTSFWTSVATYAMTVTYAPASDAMCTLVASSGDLVSDAFAAWVD